MKHFRVVSERNNLHELGRDSTFTIGFEGVVRGNNDPLGDRFQESSPSAKSAISAVVVTGGCGTGREKRPGVRSTVYVDSSPRFDAVRCRPSIGRPFRSKPDGRTSEYHAGRSTIWEVPGNHLEVPLDHL